MGEVAPRLLHLNLIFIIAKNLLQTASDYPQKISHILKQTNLIYSLHPQKIFLHFPEKTKRLEQKSFLWFFNNTGIISFYFSAFLSIVFYIQLASGFYCQRNFCIVWAYTATFFFFGKILIFFSKLSLNPFFVSLILSG